MHRYTIRTIVVALPLILRSAQVSRIFQCIFQVFQEESHQLLISLGIILCPIRVSMLLCQSSPSSIYRGRPRQAARMGRCRRQDSLQALTRVHPSELTQQLHIKIQKRQQIEIVMKENMNVKINQGYYKFQKCRK